MSDRTCLFCAHQFTASDRRRKFCWDCLPPHADDPKAYMTRYAVLHATCIQHASCSIAYLYPKPPSPPKPVMHGPPAPKPCAQCGEPTWRPKHCSRLCSRRAANATDRAKELKRIRKQRERERRVRLCKCGARITTPRVHLCDECRPVKQERPSITHCQLCETPIPVKPNGKFPKWCSQVCFMRAYRAKHSTPPKRNSHCDECGSDVPPRRFRFCSRTCAKRSENRARDYRRRQRLAEVAHLNRPYSKFAIGERDRWRCQLCGLKIDRQANALDPLAFEVDHIIPLSLGGWDAPNNVQASHRECNNAKSNRRSGWVQLSLLEVA